MFQEKFIMEQLCGISKIPIHIFEQSGVIAETFGIERESDPFCKDNELFFELVRGGDGTPALHMKEDGILYGSFQTSAGRYIVWGPVSLTVLSFREKHDYCVKHHVKSKEFPICCRSCEDVIRVMKLAYAVLEKEEIQDDGYFFRNGTEEDIAALSQYDEVRYQFEKIDEEQAHITFQEEQEFLREIESGGEYTYEPSKVARRNPVKGVGKLAGNNFKQVEYMTAISIALAARAAIRGGLNVSESYFLAELYFQKLAKCKDAFEFMQIHSAMRADFTRRVKENREKKKNKGYIEQCKEYIAQNIRQNIKVSTIAKEIGINESYLSRRFSRQEGESISGYIIKKKLEAAANMLKYSDYKISEIAAYFGFSSQSRFGEQFRKEYGKPPMEYRKTERVIDYRNQKS